MTKINILIMIEELELGGAEKVVIDQARSLDPQKYNVAVCCLREEGEFASELKKYNIELIALHKKRGVDLSIIPKIQKILRGKQIDLVHTHLWVANLWGRLAAVLAGVPVVVTEHNVDVWKKGHHKLIDRVLAPFTKKICVVSEKVKEFYSKNVGINPQKLVVVYNGIDLNLPSATSEEAVQLLKEFKIDKGTTVIANIGRLSEAKANHFFIEALEKLVQNGHNVHGLIIGEGPLRKEIEECGAELSGHGKLTFTGLRKDILKILDITSMSVLSSTREGLPIVILESMAKGVPFVATDVGGNKELIVDGQTGFIVPPRNPQALADAMAKIISDPDLSRKMRENSVKRIREGFSLEAMINKTEKVYDEVLNAK